MTINEFISGVTSNITNKIVKNSVTPAIVGDAFVDLAYIVDAFSGSTITATNGLRINNYNINLGGTLLTGTTIDLSGNTFSILDSTGNTTFNISPLSGITENYNGIGFNINSGFTILDSNLVGIINNGDFEENFVPRSLATVQFVTGWTASHEALLSASNGLTYDGNVTLGGTLTGDTIINFNTHNFQVSNGDTLFTISPSVIGLELSDDTANSELYLSDSASQLTFSNGIYNSQLYLSSNLGLIWEDNSSNSFDLNFNDSILTLGAVTSISNWQLYAGTDDFNITYSNGSSNSFFSMASDGVSLGMVESSQIFITNYDGIQVLDNTNLGFVYNSDYSTSGSTNIRWIPDLGYITNNFLVGSSLVNGLTNISGNTFGLGGQLGVATTINQNGQSFIIEDNLFDSVFFGMFPDSASPSLELGISTSDTESNIVFSTSNLGFYFNSIGGSQIINLSSAGSIQVQDTINNVGFTYNSDYSSNWNAGTTLVIPNIGYINNNFLPMSNPTFNGLLSGGNIALASTGYTLFNGNTDTNWRMGYNMSAFTYSTVNTPLTIVVGAGVTDGFAIGTPGGSSIFELKGSNLAAYFAGTITTLNDIEITDYTKGIILHAPTGERIRATAVMVDGSPTLTLTII